MRVVGRHDEIVRPELLDDIDRGLLVGVERQIALPFEIFARWQRQLMLAARAELFPLIVEPPEPPVEPAGSAFEKGAAQPGVAFEHAAGGHAGDRTHQLNRVADRMRDRVEIGVADITPAGVVPERGLAGWMEANRHAEPLDLGPQWL